jgi:hypothetical protein
MVRRHRAALAALVAGAGMLLAGAAALTAQQRGWGWGGGDRRYDAPIREGLPERRGGFHFCRLLYESVRREAGGLGWSTDYPAADNNFMVRLGQLTTTDTGRWDDGMAGIATVRASDASLFECPFLFASDVGTAGFSGSEVLRLREYLLKGGLLWVDDFWGNQAWRHWTDQIGRVLPDHDIIELTPDHPLFQTFYQVAEVPQIPSIQHWRRSGGGTSERGAESAQPAMHALIDAHGRPLVIMTHNTDIADGWERETDDPDFFYLFTARGYGVGINVAIWAMTR